MCRPQTASKPTAPRSCSWTIAPFDTATGGRMGFLRITVAGRSDFYRVTWLESDDMATQLRVEKETRDGFTDGYLVTLGCSRSYCECKGWTFNRTCRHTEALTAALRAA